MNEMQELQEKINQARAHLQRELDDFLAGSGLTRSFMLSFPDVDRASIRWYDGRVVINYRLAFLSNGGVEWRGRQATGEKVETIRAVQ